MPERWGCGSGRASVGGKQRWAWAGAAKKPAQEAKGRNTWTGEEWVPETVKEGLETSWPRFISDTCLFWGPLLASRRPSPQLRHPCRQYVSTCPEKTWKYGNCFYSARQAELYLAYLQQILWCRLSHTDYAEPFEFMILLSLWPRDHTLLPPRRIMKPHTLHIPQRT